MTDREQHRAATSASVGPRTRSRRRSSNRRCSRPHSLKYQARRSVCAISRPGATPASVATGTQCFRSPTAGWAGNRGCRRPRSGRGRRHGGRAIQLACARAHGSGRTRACARTTQRRRARLRERHDDHRALRRLGPGRAHLDLRQRGPLPGVGAQADGTTEWLDDECDPPLGVATSFRRRRADIAPGSMLIFYTDGLVERRTESIDCGMDRLRRGCEAGPDTPDACALDCRKSCSETVPSETMSRSSSSRSRNNRHPNTRGGLGRSRRRSVSGGRSRTRGPG